MVKGLERRYELGELHFVTFSCFQRLGYLNTPVARELFEDALQKVQVRYRFEVVGYVVMPEHVHLLVSEPVRELLSVGLQALKLSVARRSQQKPFWLPRYYDFNVSSTAKLVEKLNYMHRNPMKRGLTERPQDWKWSSCRYYLTGETGRVTISSSWRGS